MALVVLIVHLLVCVCLIGLVLLQRSEGGALGVGGGGSGALMSGRGAADALARMTMVAGGFFLVTSFGLTLLSGAASSAVGNSVFDSPAARTAPITAPATTTPAPAPGQPARPDPTQSSAPQATDNRLAAVLPGPGNAAAATPIIPASTNASARAAPLNPAPSTASNRPPAVTASNRPPAAATARPPAATSVPASANAGTAATTRPPAAAANRPPAATTRSGSTTTANTGASPTRPLVLPNTSGSVGGITLTDDPQINPESNEGGVTAVRRERAGPDQ